MQGRNEAEETAEKLAGEITATLLTPASPITQDNAVLNYVDFFWLGLSMNDALTKFGIMPPVSELLNAHGEIEPGRLKRAIHKRIMAKAREASPEEFRRDVRRIRELTATRRGLRQLHVHLVRAVVPAARAGRSRKIAREELPELAKRSDQLLPSIRKFLEVQKHAPNGDPMRTLEYLRDQLPQDVVQYLVQRSSLLERQYRRLPKVGTVASRARQLADILAGDNWGLSASYAVKMCKEERSKKPRS